jgi:hypothetical protein
LLGEARGGPEWPDFAEILTGTRLSEVEDGGRGGVSSVKKSRGEERERSGDERGRRRGGMERGLGLAEEVGGWFLQRAENKHRTSHRSQGGTWRLRMGAVQEERDDWRKLLVGRK